MRSTRSGLIGGLLALLLMHAPAEGQSFGPAAWIRQSWAGGRAYIPMDIAVGPEEEVFVTGQLLWFEDGWFEASADSSDIRMLDQPPDGSGFLVRYDGENGTLNFVQPGSVLPGVDPGDPAEIGEYSAGYSVTAVDGRLFHGEGIRLQDPWNSGSAMITVRDLEGSVLQRIGPRERYTAWLSVHLRGTGLDAQGNLYMAGTYLDTLYFSPDVVLAPSSRLRNTFFPDVFIASYAPDGTVRWAQEIERGRGYVWISLGLFGKAAIDVDAEGNMVWGARFYGESPAPFSAAEDGMVLAKYDRDGTLQRIWTLQDLGITYEPEFSELRNDPGVPVAEDYVPYPSKVRFDRNGNLYMLWRKPAAGNRTNTVTVDDSTLVGREDRTIVFLTKFDAQGEPLWARNFEYDYSVSANGIKVTEDGHVYVYGHFRGHYLVLEGIELTQDEELEYDGFVAHFDENGQLVKALHAAGPGYHSIHAMGIGGSGDVYVVGRFIADIAILGADTMHAMGEHNVFVAKYSTKSLSLEPWTDLPSAMIEATNYPNPFRNATTIVYRVPAPGKVRLTVYDMLGREMAVLVDRPQGGGAHSVRLDASTWPSGVCLYRLEAGNQVATGRLVHRK